MLEENIIESFKPHAKNYTGHRSFDQFLILKFPGMNQRSDTACQTATEGVRKAHLSMSSVSLPGAGSHPLERGILVAPVCVSVFIFINIMQKQLYAILFDFFLFLFLDRRCCPIVEGTLAHDIIKLALFLISCLTFSTSVIVAISF